MVQAPDSGGGEWDVALAGLLEQEHARLRRSLAAADLVMLARDHATRLDDIMHTLSALCAAGRWLYRGADGTTEPWPAAALSAARIGEQDLAGVTGSWAPATA